MDEILGYDDKLEIMNEFGSLVNGSLYDGTYYSNDYCDQD